MAAMSFRTTLIQRLDAYEKLLRLNKPVGIYLLLWPTLWGLVLAYRPYPYSINWLVPWIFVLGTVLMRSAGCAINDYADRAYDGHVARTRERPLVSGLIRPWEALALATFLALVAFVLVWQLNALTIWMSVPAVLLAGSYPFTKRFLALPQAYLGLAFSFGIPMAFAAVQGSVPPLAWALFACNVLWTVAYDTAYAMVDREDDLKIGIRTSAITFGRFDVAAVAVCHVLSLGGLLAIGLWQGYGPAYYGGWAMAVILSFFVVRQVATRDPRRCFQAFLDNHWIGLVLLLGMIADVYLGRGAREAVLPLLR